MESNFNLKPNYIISDFIDYYKNKELNSIDNAVIKCIIEILEDSDKFLFHNYFENYVYDLESFKTINNSFNQKSNFNFDNLPKNFSLEYYNPYNNQEIIINIIDFKHPLFKKLLNLLGQSNTLINKKSKAIFYFEKNKNEWLIPVETIYLNENGEDEKLKIFPSRAFKLKNSLENKEKLDSFKGFFGGILDLFKTIFCFFGEDQEYVYIPPIYKDKNNKGYLYKVPQIFLQNPTINIKTDQSLSINIKNRNKIFYRDKANLKDSLFLK